jgi:hypothetical protein
VIRGEDIHPSLIDFPVLCKKSTFCELVQDAIKHPLSPTQERLMVDCLYIKIMVHDNETLSAMRVERKNDFKVWRGDIIQYFFHKMMVGEALPMDVGKNSA